MSTSDVTACLACEVQGKDRDPPGRAGTEQVGDRSRKSIPAGFGGSERVRALRLPHFCLHVGSSDPVSFCCRAWMIPSFEGLQEAGQPHD